MANVSPFEIGQCVVVFPELALALGRSRRSVKAAVREAALAQKPPASLGLPSSYGPP